MSIWESRVRGEVKSAADLLKPALRNTLSRFLDLLSEALSETQSRGMLKEATSIVKTHARDRARDTVFGPNQVIQELQVLREVVTSKLEKSLHLSEQDYATIQKTFDQAIQEALLEYFLMHAELREQFVATLTHDLRGPLSSARMSVDLARRVAASLYDREKGGRLEEHLARTNKTLRRADGMIQELLDASILRVGEKLPLKLSKCELMALIQEAISDLREEEQGRVRLTGERVEGVWDADGLRRSIGNLITNAVKYGAEKQPIQVRVERAGERVRVSVHNEGNPISEQDQKMLFQSFHRSKSAIESGHKGWGIGLSLARAVSEELGGKIGVESGPEKGTTFTIEIPVNSGGAPEEPRHLH